MEVGAMVKLGELRQKRFERITFRDWTLRGYAHTGKFVIRILFPPAKFPSFTLIFEDEKNQMEVKMTVKASVFKEVMNALGIPLRKGDMPALVVDVQVDENGLVYGLDVENSKYVLAWTGSYWRRREESQKEDWMDELKDSF
jgi:hypothetical protein